MAPLLIGLFIFTAADAIGPASGGSFNPARSLHPVIYNWDFGDVWIYVVGALVGGVIGGAIWVLFGPARVHERATIRATGGVPQSQTTRRKGRWKSGRLTTPTGDLGFCFSAGARTTAAALAPAERRRPAEPRHRPGGWPVERSCRATNHGRAPTR